MKRDLNFSASGTFLKCIRNSIELFCAAVRISGRQTDIYYHRFTPSECSFALGSVGKQNSVLFDYPSHMVGVSEQVSHRPA